MNANSNAVHSPRLPAVADISSALQFRTRKTGNAVKSASGMFSVYHAATIADIPEAQWNRLFPDASEDWGYFLGCERSGSAHFKFSALGVYRGTRLVAASPLFRLDYRLDMTLPDRLKSISEWLAQRVPRLATVTVLGMGSPMTEECPIGVDPALSQDDRKAAIQALIAGIEAHASAEGIKMLALKDVRNEDKIWAGGVLRKNGYAMMASLPVATLPLPYDDIEGYLKSMPSKARSDMRRKFRSAEGMTFEWRTDIDDIYDEVIDLYRATRAHRKASYEAFDEVPEDYFREVMHRSHGKARVLLTRIDGKLASFNLTMFEKDKAIGKFLGMDYEVSRKNNLYFVNWMKVMELCMELGIKELQTGQTTYTVKTRMGCKLKRSWIYFKHTGLVLGALFRLIGPRISFDAADPDLAALGDKVRYV